MFDLKTVNFEPNHFLERERKRKEEKIQKRKRILQEKEKQEEWMKKELIKKKDEKVRRARISMLHKFLYFLCKTQKFKFRWNTLHIIIDSI